MNSKSIGLVAVVAIACFFFWEDARSARMEAKISMREAQEAYASAHSMLSGRSEMCEDWLFLSKTDGLKKELTEAEVQEVLKTTRRKVANALLENFVRSEKLFAGPFRRCMTTDAVIETDSVTVLNTLCESDPWVAGAVFYDRLTIACDAS